MDARRSPDDALTLPPSRWEITTHPASNAAVVNRRFTVQKPSQYRYNSSDIERLFTKSPSDNPERYTAYSGKEDTHMNTLNEAEWTPSKRLARGSAAEQILEDVREQILSKRIARGAKLPTEKKLADIYGVSSATVREAIRGLATMQLVDVRHGSGAYVTAEADQLLALSLNSMIQLEGIDIAQVLGVLGALNSYAAELAVTHASEEDMAAMSKALDDADQGASVGEILNGLIQFIDALALASGNPLLAGLCRFLAGVQFSLARKLALDELAKWRQIAGQLSKERRDLFNAIKARDTERACAAARTYHTNALKVITAMPNAGLEPAL
jgi:GntR family transcriptional repressor for pyruvate dehydrogenase complex